MSFRYFISLDFFLESNFRLDIQLSKLLKFTKAGSEKKEIGKVLQNVMYWPYIYDI